MGVFLTFLSQASGDWRDNSVKFFKLLKEKTVYTWEQNDKSNVNQLYGIRFRFEESSDDFHRGKVYGDIFLVEGDQNDTVTVEASYFENATQLSFMNRNHYMTPQQRSSWKGQLPSLGFIHYNEGTDKIMIGVVDQVLEPNTEEQLKARIAERGKKIEKAKELFQSICKPGNCFSSEWKINDRSGMLIIVFKTQNAKKSLATGEMFTDSDTLYRKKFKARLEAGKLKLTLEELTIPEIAPNSRNLKDRYIYCDENYEFELNEAGFEGNSQPSYNFMKKLVFTEDEISNYPEPSDKEIAARKARAKEDQADLNKYSEQLKKDNDEMDRRIAQDQAARGSRPSFGLRPPTL